MPRVKGGTVTRKRRKRILKLSKGYYGSKHTLYRTANEQVLKSLTYAYRDRKQTKRNFRKLWITRINAAARMEGLSYSQFMHGLKLANVDVNRKMLADLAVNDLNAFNQLVAISKDALANPPAVVEEAPVVEETPVVKEVKAEPKKEVAKEVNAEPKKEAAKEVKDEPKKEETAVAGPTDAKALAKLTVVELRELAKEREIAIPSGSLKADIVKLLSE